MNELNQLIDSLERSNPKACVSVIVIISLLVTTQPDLVEIIFLVRLQLWAMWAHDLRGDPVPTSSFQVCVLAG